jgi:hypothetical protein
VTSLSGHVHDLPAKLPGVVRFTHYSEAIGLPEVRRSLGERGIREPPRPRVADEQELPAELQLAPTDTRGFDLPAVDEQWTTADVAHLDDVGPMRAQPKLYARNAWVNERGSKRAARSMDGKLEAPVRIVGAAVASSENAPRTWISWRKADHLANPRAFIVVGPRYRESGAFSEERSVTRGAGLLR